MVVDWRKSQQMTSIKAMKRSKQIHSRYEVAVCFNITNYREATAMRIILTEGDMTRYWMCRFLVVWWDFWLLYGN